MDQTANTYYIEVNSLGWLIGFITMAALAVVCFRIYKSSSNKLFWYYGINFTLFAPAFLFYSLPFMFGLETETLRLSIFLFEMIIFIGLIWQFVILWYMKFKEKLSAWAVVIPAAALAAVGIYFSYTHGINAPVSLVDNFNFGREVGQSTTFVQSIMLIGPLAVGLTFLDAARKASSMRAKTRAFTMFIFNTVPSSLAISSYFLYEAGLYNSNLFTSIYIAVFLILLVSLTLQFKRK